MHLRHRKRRTETTPRMSRSSRTSRFTRASIDKIPREILTEIFSSSLPVRQGLGDLNETPPRNLIRVCRYWRDVVLSTQRLWTRWCFILVDPNEQGIRKASYFLQQYLDHSGSAPITLDAHVSDCELGTVLAEFLNALFATQRR